jgi:hypothetical protein
MLASLLRNGVPKSRAARYIGGLINETLASKWAQDNTCNVSAIQIHHAKEVLCFRAIPIAGCMHSRIELSNR